MILKIGRKSKEKLGWCPKVNFFKIFVPPYFPRGKIQKDVSFA